MPVRAEITEKPGLIELLSREEPTPDSRMSEALDEFRSSRGVAETRVATGLEDLDLPQGVASEGERTGWWEELRRWFTREEHDVVSEEKQAVELEAYWLTLPDVQEASVKLIATVESAEETSASLTILGIGGGPTFTVDIKEGLEHQAMEAERATLSAPGTFQKVRVTRDGDEVGEYVRLASLDRNNLEWAFPPAPPIDPASCGAQVSSERFDASSSGGATTKMLDISAGTKWDFGADLSFKKLGLEAKLDASVTYTRDVAFQYELPGRHLYIATRYEKFPAYLWTGNAA